MGGLGCRKENYMNHFKYVTAEEARPYKERVLNMTRELQDRVRDYFTFQNYFIGSSARNMITFDERANIGFDFDINYAINDFEQEYGPDEIHQIIFKGLSNIYLRYGFNRIEESTRVITLKKIDPFNSRILHGCDIALVNDYEDDGRQCQEYIRFNKSLHNFTWEQQTAPYYLEEKVSEIKKAKLWNEVREVYINKKNNNDNPNKKSRALYAETLNEVYMRI